MAAITFTYCPEEMRHYLVKHGFTVKKEKRVFSDDNENQRFFRLNGGKLDLPNMEERTVEILRDSEGKELMCEDELSFHRKTSLLEVTFTELLRNKLLTV
jgi:hypothetical protein